MVAIDQTNAFRLCSPFENLRSAFQLQILDQGNRVAVCQNSAVGILDDTRFGRLGLAFPLVTASEAFPVIRILQNFSHLA